MSIDTLSLGCRMPVDEWVALNRIGVFRDRALRSFVSPFPPPNLMQNVSGLTTEEDFASHGADMYLALTAASPKPLTEYQSILDFGCGCGRLARMFFGHPHQVAGCDIDRRHIEWVQSVLGFMTAKVSAVHPPIPFAAGEFDCVISISIFTHLTEASQDEFLADLSRVTRANGYLFLTVHGRRAMDRALSEPRIRSMLDISDDLFASARSDFEADRHAFVLQQGHLTTTQGAEGKVIDEPFEYGISFTSEAYVRQHWSSWFDIVEYRSGAIHDFQDIVVLSPKQ